MKTLHASTLMAESVPKKLSQSRIFLNALKWQKWIQINNFVGGALLLNQQLTSEDVL